jgi:DNA polymerase
LAQSLDSATREAVLTRVSFYRDLGITEFYRRPVDPALLAQLAAAAEVQPAAGNENSDSTQTLGAPSIPLLSVDSMGDHESQSASASQPDIFQEDNSISPRRAIPIPPPRVAAEVPVAERAAALQLIRDEIGDCTRCPLHKGRNKLVFGDGSPLARLMFVGEGPGADEDAQGLPFVGRAGQLLNNMITAMGLKREEVYIANVVKCRPPGNRVPEPEEMATCSPFLFHQIDVIRPRHATHRYLSSRVPFARSAPEEGSLGRLADCHARTGAETAQARIASDASRFHAQERDRSLRPVSTSSRNGRGM